MIHQGTLNYESISTGYQYLHTLFERRTLPAITGFSIYAKEKARLKRSGRIVSEFDLLIGATALRYDLTLVTRNTKDFTHLAGIQLKNWIDN